MTAFNNPSFRSDTLQEKAKPDLFNPEDFGIEVPEKLSVPATVEDTTSMPPEQVAGSVKLPRFNLDEFLAEPAPPAPPTAEQAFSPQEMAASQAMRQMGGTVNQFGGPSQPVGLDPNYEAKLQQMRAVEQMQTRMIEQAPDNDVARILSMPLGDMNADDLRTLDEMFSELQLGDPTAPEMDPAFVQLVKQRHAEAMRENRPEFPGGFFGTLAGGPTTIVAGAITAIEGAKKIVPKALEATWDAARAEAFEATEGLVPGARAAKYGVWQKQISDFTGEEIEGREKGSVEKAFDIYGEYQEITDDPFLGDFALALAEASVKIADEPEFRASLKTIKELDAQEMTLDSVSRVWGQGMASLAIMLVGGALAGPAGVAATGASMEASSAALSQYHNVRQKLIDEGLDEKQAHKQAQDAAFVTGAYYGAASGVLEYVGAKQIAAVMGLSKIAFGAKTITPSVRKSLTQRVALWMQAAGAEGGTELSQMFADKIISIAQDPTIPFNQKQQEFQNWWKQQSLTQGEGIMSFTAGALSGGAAVTPTLAIGQMRDMMTRSRLRAMMEQAAEAGIQIPDPTSVPAPPIAPPQPAPGDPIELLAPQEPVEALEAPVEPSPDAAEAPVAPVEPTLAPEAPAAPVPVEAPVEPVEAPVAEPVSSDPEALVDTDLGPNFKVDPATNKIVYVPSDIAEPTPAPEEELTETVAPTTYTYDSVAQDDTALDEFVGDNLDAIEEALQQDKPHTRRKFQPISNLFDGDPTKSNQPLKNETAKKAFVDRLKQSVDRVKQRQERAAQDVVPDTKKAAPEQQAAAVSMPTKKAGNEILAGLKDRFDPGQRLKDEREGLDVSLDDAGISGAGGKGDFRLYLLPDTFAEATKDLSPAKKQHIAKHFSIDENIPSHFEEDTQLLDWYLAPEEARQKFVAEEAFVFNRTGDGINFEQLRAAAMPFSGLVREAMPQTVLDLQQLEAGDSFTFSNGVGNLRIDNVTDQGLEVTATLPGAFEGLATGRGAQGVIYFDETVIVDETYFASEEAPAVDWEAMAGPERKDRDEYNPATEFFQLTPVDVTNTLDPETANQFEDSIDDLNDLLDGASQQVTKEDDGIPFSASKKFDKPDSDVMQEIAITNKLFEAMQKLTKTQVIGFMELAHSLNKAIKQDLPIKLTMDAYEKLYVSYADNTSKVSLTQKAMTDPGHIRRLYSDIGIEEFTKRIDNAKNTTSIEPEFVLYEFGYSRPTEGKDKRRGIYWDITFRHGTGERPLNEIFRHPDITGNAGDVGVFETYTGIKARSITYQRKPARKGLYTWRVYTDDNPTAGFVRALELASQGEGAQTVDRQHAATAKHTAISTLRDARKLEDKHQPRQLADARLAQSISESTANAIKRGKEVGIPDAVINAQLADIGLIKEAYFGPKIQQFDETIEDMPKGPRNGFILANEAGTGKTFVLLGAAAEILNDNPDATVVYVTTGNNLRKQISEDAENTDLRLKNGDLVTKHIQIVTYAQLRSARNPVRPFDSAAIKKGLEEGSDAFNRVKQEGRYVLILDEPDSEMAGVPNLHKPTGQIVKNLISDVKASGGLTVFASATPFKNPVDAQYLAASGMFGEPVTFTDESSGVETTIPGFTKWAVMFGAETRFNPKNNTIVPMWPKPTESVEQAKKAQEDAIGASEWFAKRGMFTRRTKVLPKKLTITDPETGQQKKTNFVEMTFSKVDIGENVIPGDAHNRTYSEYAEQLTKAFDALVDESDEGMAQNTWAWLTHRLKRISEGGKVDAAKDKIQAHLDAGRQIAVFTETKADTQIGKFQRPEYLAFGGQLDYWKDDDGLYEPDEVIKEYEEWLADDKAGVMPFSVVSYDIARLVKNDPSLAITLPSVADELLSGFNDEETVRAAEYTGRVSDQQANANLKKWETNEVPILIVTMGKGGTGLSLHDKLGNRPNGSAQIMLSLPWVAAKVDQVSGRLARYGMKSPVYMEWLFARSQDMPFESGLANRVAQRMKDLGATVKGLSKEDMQSISQLESFHFEGTVDATDTILDGYRGEDSASAHQIRVQDYAQAQTEETRTNYRTPVDPNPETISSRRPVAMLFARLLGANKPNNQKILDPSAGKGDALIYMDYSNSITIVDPKATHITAASTKLPASMNSYQGNFDDPGIYSKIREEQGQFDSIAMVPPIAPNSKGDSLLAYSHIESAFDLLNDNGRLVTIVPWSILQDSESPGYNTFFDWLAEQNVVVAPLHKSVMGYHSAILVFDAGASEAGISIVQNNENMLNFETIEAALPERPNPNGTAVQEEFRIDPAPEDNIYSLAQAHSPEGSILSQLPDLAENNAPRDNPSVRSDDPLLADSSEYTDALGVDTNLRHEVTPAPLPENVPLKRLSLRQVRLDLQKVIGRPVSRPKRMMRGAGGFYQPKTGQIAIRYHNDFLTMAHEVGHFIHDHFGLLSELTPDMLNIPLGKARTRINNTTSAQQKEKLELLANFDESLLFFLTANGSSAKASSSPQYKRQEMVAAFIVEYLFNPDSAKEKSPWFYEYFENAIRTHPEHGGKMGDDFITGLHVFGLRVRAFYHGNPWFKLVGMFADSDFYENMMLPWVERMDRVLASFAQNVKDKLGYGRLRYLFIDDRHYLLNLIDELGLEAGGKDWEKTFVGERNPLNRLSGLGGFDDNFAEQLKFGPRNVETGRRELHYGLQEIFASLIPEGQTSDARIFESKLRLEAFMLNQSALEDARNNHRYAIMLITALEDLAAVTDAIAEIDLELRLLKRAKDDGDITHGEYRVERIVLRESKDNLVIEKRFHTETIQKYRKRLNISKDNLEPDKILQHVARKNSRITPAGLGLESAEPAHERLEQWLQDQDNWEPGEFERYERAAQMWRDWADAMVLKPLVDSGRMSNETYQSIKEERQQYVTMKRTLESRGMTFVGPVVGTYDDLRLAEEIRGQPGKSLGKGMAETPMRRGSTADIAMPTEQLVKMAYDARFEAQRNLIGRAIVELIKETEAEGSNISTRTPVPATSQIMQPASETQEANLTVFIDGEAQGWHVVDKRAAKAFETLNDDVSFALLNWFNIVRGTMQSFIVNSLPFAVRNKFRDAWDRAFKSQGGSMPWDSFVVAKAATKAIVKRDKNEFTSTYSEYLEAESQLIGAGGSQVGLWYSIRGGKQNSDKFVQRAIKELAGPRNVYGNIWTTTKNAGRTYLELVRSGEMTNRVAEYRRVKAKYLEQGFSENDARLEAMRASRELIDFAVAGKWSRQIGRIVMFFNPSIQGLRSTARVGKRSMPLFFFRLLTYSVIPSVMTYAWNMLMGYEEEYAELPDWQRSMFWNLALPGGGWVKVPKPYEIGVAGSFFEMGAMHIRGKRDPYSALGHTMRQLLGPLETVRAGFFGPLSGVVARYSNRHAFHKTPIVPPYEMAKPVDQRNQEKFANVPAIYQTSWMQWLTDILTVGDAIGGRSVAGDTKDPRMARAVFEAGFGIRGKQIALAYQLAAEPSIENLGQNLEYMAGSMIDVGFANRLRSRSLDKFYRLSQATENTREASSKYRGHINNTIKLWKAEDDQEARAQLYNGLINDIHLYIDQLEEIKQRDEELKENN